MQKRLMALALAAGLQASLGQAMAGQSELGMVNSISTPRLAPPATRRASSTHSAQVSAWGYASGPGWSVAQVKRMATKRRNRARNKQAHRGVR